MMIFLLMIVFERLFSKHFFSICSKNSILSNGSMAPIRMVLRSKIHRASVTQADLDYVGSISIDEDLMEAAGIAEWEKIAVLDVTNGSRLETYAIKAPPGSGEICINGAAAHLVEPGDLVILLTFQGIEEVQIENHEPRIVHVDEQNKVIELSTTESNF